MNKDFKYWLVVWNIYYFSILGIIIPADFHIFQRVRYTTNQMMFCDICSKPLRSTCFNLMVTPCLWMLLVCSNLVDVILFSDMGVFVMGDPPNDPVIRPFEN